MKNKNKSKYFAFLLIGILFVSILPSISAEELQESQGFNIINWFTHNFNIGSFTIVGQDRKCSTSPTKTYYYNAQELMNVRAETDCGSGYALYDVFDKNWNRLYETENFLSKYCTYSIGCIVEAYCCPHPQCSSDTECSAWYGTESKCFTKNAVDPYLKLVDKNLNPLNSYKYCSSSCSGSPITCWRVEGNVCNSRAYDCSYETYPNCPSSYPFKSQSQCVSSITTQCASEGESCGYSATAPTCCSGLTCKNFGCYPEEVCGNSICESGETKTSCPSDCGAAPVCGDGLCESGETLGATYECVDDCNVVCPETSELRNDIQKWINGDITRDNLGVKINTWAKCE